jgi:peptide/nickel transport system permease protein
MGLAGIIIILFFVLLAALAPVLTNHDPVNNYSLASSYAVPIWAKVFPQYASLPVNQQMLAGNQFQSQSDLQHWNISTIPSGSPNVTYSTSPQGLVLDYVQAGSIAVSQTFEYPWSYPCGFITGISVTPLGQNLTVSQLSLDEYIATVNGTGYHVMGPSVYASGSAGSLKVFRSNNVTSFVIDPSSNLRVDYLALGGVQKEQEILNKYPCQLAQIIFPHQGEITTTFIINSTVPAKVAISNPFVNIAGSAYGILGTDDKGRDVWSQFVYGARISLEVGIFASLIAILIGTVVGLVAGFFGGIVDEVLMRFNDFLLVLPFLPFLLVLISVIDALPIRATLNTEVLILLLIGLLGWNGTARIIRSQVLSVKQRQFVEASKALGSGGGHIIRKHIFPNVLGLVYANLAITVPSAILTEAALAFLGFGSPLIISWGEMLSFAESSVTSQIHQFVWWWFIPPGVSIAVLSTAFVFLGFTLDAIFNPKFRKR